MSRLFCVRCDEPIRPGEPYDTHIHHGASRAGWTTYSHRNCADPRPPTEPDMALPAGDDARTPPGSA